MQTGENHTRHPEEDDVAARYQHRCRIELLHLRQRLFIRPAQRFKRPQAGREPGVQNVLIALQVGGLTLGAAVRLVLLADNFAAILTVPHRDAMPPPQLAGYTPVADVLQPTQIDFLKSLRHKADITGLYGFNRRLRQGLHLHEPLGRNQRLNHAAATVTFAHRVADVLDFFQQAQLVHIRNHSLAALISVQPLVSAGIFVHFRVLADNGNLRQVVAQAHLKIVRVVRGGNFHGTGSEVFVNIFVRNNRNFTSDQGQNKRFSDQMRIAFIFGMYGNSGIAQKRFGTGGGDNYHLIAVLYRILNMPEMSCLLGIFHLGIGKSGGTARTPVDDTVALINETFFIKGNEYFFHSFGKGFVHGKAFARPVAGASQLFELIDNAVSVKLFPFPNTFGEFFASQIVTRQSFFLTQIFFYFNLRCNAHVVGSGNPKSGKARHSFVAD